MDLAGLHEHVQSQVILIALILVLVSILQVTAIVGSVAPPLPGRLVIYSEELVSVMILML